MGAFARLPIGLDSCALVACLLLLTGCTPSDVRQLDSSTARHQASSAPPPAAAGENSPTVTPGSAIGLLPMPVATAILLTHDAAPPRWCVSFSDTLLAIGDTVTLVWPDSEHVQGPPSLRTRVRRVRQGRCPLAERSMSDTLERLDEAPDDPALELVPADSTMLHSAGIYPIAIAIGSRVPWVRGPDRHVRADVDGDGFLELARSCASLEGLHLTLWTVLRPGVAPDSGETLRWHSYRPLGYDMVPDCTERQFDR